MATKKKKNKTKEVDFEKMEEEISVLSYMNDDLQNIVQHENESYTDVSNVYQSKKEIVTDEEEKINIILQELLLSCDHKKSYLDKCVEVANHIIHKNEQIIEKEKEAIKKLINEKQEEIQKIQKKTEYTKSVNDSLKIALTDIFRNLSMFLNKKIAMNVNLDELLSLGEEMKMSEEDTDLKKKEKKKNDEETNTEKWKQKLYASVESYVEQLQNAKQLIHNHHPLKKEPQEKKSQEEVPKKNTLMKENTKGRNEDCSTPIVDEEMDTKEEPTIELTIEENVKNLSIEPTSNVKSEENKNNEHEKESFGYNDTLTVLQNNVIENEKEENKREDDDNNNHKKNSSPSKSSGSSNSDSSSSSSSSSSGSDNTSSNESSNDSSDESSDDSDEESSDATTSESDYDSSDEEKKKKSLEHKKETTSRKNKKNTDAKIDTFIEKIKNMDYDYVSYFQKKLKNS